LFFFSVAFVSGETVRGDAVTDVANKMVSLHKILLYRPQKVKVVLPPKMSCDLLADFLTPTNRVKLFVF